MRRSCSLTRQSLTLAGSTALAQALFALLLVLVARYSGPSAFGVTASALGIGAFLARILDYGFTGYSLRELAAGRLSHEDFWHRLRTKLAVVLLAAGVLVVIGFTLARPQLGGMVALVLVSRTLLHGLDVPLRAVRRVGRAAMVIVLEKASWLAAFAVLAMSLSVDPLTAFWWSMAASALIAATVGLVSAGGVTPFLRRGRLCRPWMGDAGYGTFGIAVSLSMLDVALLGAVGGITQAGAYGAVTRWTQPVLLLSQTFSATAAPLIAAARSSRAAFAAIRGSLWIPALGLVVCLAMVLLAPLAVTIMLGQSYRESAPILAILAAGAGAVVLTQPLATFLQSRGHARLVGCSTIVTVLLQLAAVALTGGSLGAKGAALSYAATQLLLLFVLSTGVALITVSQRRREVRQRVPVVAISGARRMEAAGQDRKP